MSVTQQILDRLLVPPIFGDGSFGIQLSLHTPTKFSLLIP